MQRHEVDMHVSPEISNYLHKKVKSEVLWLFGYMSNAQGTEGYSTDFVTL